MPYYKDVNNRRTSDEKRRSAQQRGGFEDEGARYSTAPQGGARAGQRPVRPGDRTAQRPAHPGDQRPARTGDRPVRSGDRQPGFANTRGNDFRFTRSEQQPYRGRGTGDAPRSYDDQRRERRPAEGAPRSNSEPRREYGKPAYAPHSSGEPRLDNARGGYAPRSNSEPRREFGKPAFAPRPNGEPRLDNARGGYAPRSNSKPRREYGRPASAPRSSSEPRREFGKPAFAPRPNGEPRREYGRPASAPRSSSEPRREFGKPAFAPRPNGEPRREFGKPAFAPRPNGEPRRTYGRPANAPRPDGEPRREYEDADRAPRPTAEPRRDFGRAAFTPRPTGEPHRAPRAVPAPGNFNDFRFEEPARAPRPVERALEPMEQDMAMNENLLSGRNPIREALKSGRDIEKLLVARGELSGSAREILAMAKEQHVLIQEVDRVRLDAITPNHQGMLAFASAYQYHTVEEMLALAKERGEAPFLVVLDGITDPHNLGAIIRTAECAGVHGVIVQERRAVGLTPAAVKASSGAIEYIMVARVTNLVTTLETLKQQNIWAYAADMAGESYETVDFKGGVALVIGAEGEGVSRLVLEKCDKRVALPVRGKLDSLNASVAAGILLYAVLRSR